MAQFFVLSLDDAGAEPAVVGAKGAALARLAAAGLPVPSGFHVTTGAYREFVDRNGLREPILSAAARVDPDLPISAEAAARRIAGLFARHEPPTEVAGPVRWAYAGLGDRDHLVAVRSSAVGGEVPDAAFADGRLTVLGVRGESAVLTAIRRCWASLWSARAIEYRARAGLDHGEAVIGVVVQTLVPADAAGVMSTAAPAAGEPAEGEASGEAGGRLERGRILLNAVWGLGVPVASGRVAPDTVIVEKGTGRIAGRRIADKALMTILSGGPGGGTHEEPVPERWRTEPVLGPDQAARLARLGERIEALFERPMDVDWALYGGDPYILQARPLVPAAGAGAGTAAGAAATEVWNDSLGGDHLWSCGGLGEAVQDVMTPCTWSLVQTFVRSSSVISALRDHPAYGNIGGRLYTNLSVADALTATLGRADPESRIGLLEQVFGRLPPGVEVPPARVSRVAVAGRLLPAEARARRRARAARKRLPDFLESSPGRCEALLGRIREETDPVRLAGLWRGALLPFFTEACHLLEAAGRERAAAWTAVRRHLRPLVDDADADAMLTGLAKPGGAPPAGLGPVTGLAHLVRGDLDEAAYLRQWGHRGPHEFEISAPRPAEDPAWLQEQVSATLALSGRDLDRAPGHRHEREGRQGHRHGGDGGAPDAVEIAPDALELMRRQREASRAAWRRFRASHPQKVAVTRRRVGRWAQAAHDRDAAWSEVMRAYRVLRAFVLRAGELTGRGADLFFLTADEILDVLEGDGRPLEEVPVRRRTYDRYRALAPYPVLIRGRFDPDGWAARRGHRTDFYDAAEPLAPLPPVPADAALSGRPGAAGVAEGTVRVLEAPERGAELRPGEVLVTGAADVGWTLLFPRAAAVVTDVGAHFSHGAFVARELGVPAVLGCGNATTRLRTGDRVRVDGARGTVEILSGAPAGTREPQLTREG
ncbi:hypothetical protein GCM10023085_58430 [Actinomadura viridis]|uniref:Pyruvate,water dikinase n=1 Tax=Actinomadura viridis TaxID=58110 RepID=A0A931GUN8_9ACTN|nr:PEP/pyruvate-binding domain-containing protein [Actinomadura viridis]MBG6093364.1 pyruvate,water dikinase [Actinomadura viridis]